MRELRAAETSQNAEAVEALNARGPMAVLFRTQGRCLVCGFSEIRTDEVVDRGVVFLAECPRCQHRWTSREPIAPVESRSTPLEPAAPVGFARVPAKVARGTLPAA